MYPIFLMIKNFIEKCYKFISKKKDKNFNVAIIFNKFIFKIIFDTGQLLQKRKKTFISLNLIKILKRY